MGGRADVRQGAGQAFRGQEHSRQPLPLTRPLAQEVLESFPVLAPARELLAVFAPALGLDRSGGVQLLERSAHHRLHHFVLRETGVHVDL